MRIDNVKVKSFKNLKDFFIDIDEGEMNTVLIGQNATGKSNFIEALILIFKYLDLQKNPPKHDYFDFEINYKCRTRNIFVKLEGNKYEFKVNNEAISKSNFYAHKEYLPRYIFTYYSGQSDRLDKLFWEHQKRFYDNIIKRDFNRNNIDDLRRLFYVKQIHSFFVLLAFYAFEQEEKKSKDFLKRLFNIEDVESILFVLKDPGNLRGGDERFFYAEGLVKEFLSSVWDYALAPIYYTERVSTDFRSEEKRERLYLYISDKEKLKAFVKHYFNSLNSNSSNTNLFKALESTYISNLLEETRIKVKKNVDGEVTFKELSEGEQQLLTVLGLLKFTKDDETLVLLDEPDTHLNPRWNWEYIDLLNQHVKETSSKQDDTTQIIINTHDPLVIGSLKKNQVQIFLRNDKTGLVTATRSEIDPEGLGVAGILTNIFDLPTTLDKNTQKLLEERNELLYKEEQTGKLSESDVERVKQIFNDLKKYGFNQIFKDPFYTEYLIALGKHKQLKNLNFIDKESIENITSKILDKYIAKKNTGERRASITLPNEINVVWDITKGSKKKKQKGENDPHKPKRVRTR